MKSDTPRQTNINTDGYDQDFRAGDDDEVVAGRQEAPWTQVHDWVALSGIPPESIAAYLFLRMHLNRVTGLVNPGTVRLSVLLGLSRADKVASVIRPLVAIGAVEVERYGMPRRNRYVVHSLPPPGYTGPMSLREWARGHEEAIAVRREAIAADTASRRKQNRRSDPVAPDTGRQGEPVDNSPVAPDTGRHVDTGAGRHVDTDTGRKPHVVDPDVGQPPPPPPADPPAAAADEAVPGEEGEASPDHHHPTTRGTDDGRDRIVDDFVGSLVRSLPELAGTRPAGRRRLRVATTAALTRGVPLRIVAAAAVADLTGLDNPAAGIAARLDRLQPPPPEPEPRPRHCGSCYEPTRMVVDDHDRWTPCPTCHPVEATCVS